MKILGHLLRISLKLLIIAAVALIAVYSLPLVILVALVLGLMVILRWSWSMLTPRKPCGNCAVNR